MNRRNLLVCVGALALGLSSWSFGAEGDAPAANPKPTAAQPARPLIGGGGVSGGNPWGAQGGAAWGRFGLWQTVNLIQELNMTPDFTLSAEQKEKIQSIRDAAKKEQETWRESHAADFKGFQDQMMALRGNDPANGPKWQEIGKAQAELMATAPKEDEAIAQVKGVLTNEQLKRMEAETERRKAEAERMQKEMMERYKKAAAPPAAPPPQGKQ